MNAPQNPEAKGWNAVCGSVTNGEPRLCFFFAGLSAGWWLALLTCLWKIGDVIFYPDFFTIAIITHFSSTILGVIFFSTKKIQPPMAKQIRDLSTASKAKKPFCFRRFFKRPGETSTDRFSAFHPLKPFCQFIMLELRIQTVTDVTVTTRIIPFLVGNPYKPSFETVTGWKVDRIYEPSLR